MTGVDLREAMDALDRGDLARARRLCREALQAQARDPHCWRVLGMVDVAAGDLTSARQALLRSLELQPAQGEALLELARIDSAEGSRNAAIAGFRRAVETDPRPEVLVRAGEGLGNLGYLADAEACFRRALEAAPDMAAARFNLGLARLAAGAAEEGRDLMAQVVAARPEFAPARLHLGGALNATGRYREAIDAFNAYLERVPDDPLALTWLGASLQFLGHFEAAESRYREALKRAPDLADAHANLGKLLQGQGRPKEAEEHFRQALHARPEHPEALSGLVGRLDNQGRYEEGLALLERASVDARSHQLAPIHARILRHLGRSGEARTLLEGVAARPGLPADARVQLDFSLAAVADQQADYASAWAFARRANARRRSLLPPGAPEAGLEAMAAAVADIKGIFALDAIADMASSACPSERPVFLVGMPRSGKSLAEQILCSHGSVHGAGELTVLGDVSGEISARVGAWPGSAPRVSALLLQEQARRYLDELDRIAGPGAERVTDTMPFNFVHLGMIQMLFPRARVIHCVRHPMDLVLRCYFKNFAGRSLSFAFALEDIARYYLLYSELMAHWTQVLSLKVHVLRYESLVTDPATETARLLDFLGLPWDPMCLRFHEPAVATSAADTPVRRPLDDREVGAWKNYRDHLEGIARQLPVEEYEHGGT